MVAQSEAIAAPLLSQCLDDDKELFVTTQGVVVDRVDEQTAEVRHEWHVSGADVYNHKNVL